MGQRLPKKNFTTDKTGELIQGNWGFGGYPSGKKEIRFFCNGRERFTIAKPGNLHSIWAKNDGMGRKRGKKWRGKGKKRKNEFRLAGNAIPRNIFCGSGGKKRGVDGKAEILEVESVAPAQKKGHLCIKGLCGIWGKPAKGKKTQVLTFGGSKTNRRGKPSQARLNQRTKLRN